MITSKGELCVHNLRVRLEYLNATKLTLTQKVDNATLQLIELDDAIRKMINIQPITFASYARTIEKVGKPCGSWNPVQLISFLHHYLSQVVFL